PFPYEIRLNMLERVARMKRSEIRGGSTVRPLPDFAALHPGYEATNWRDSMDVKTYPVTHTEAEWRKLLTPEQFHIMREHGTERPGSCALNHEKRSGTFACAGCGQDLFKSKRKFESGTGWPSFNDPEPGAVDSTEDRAYGMLRTEVHCSRC